MKFREVQTAEIPLEFKLLLLCCSPQPSESDGALLKNLVRQELDWDQVFMSASRHAVIPLLFSHLSKTCQEAVPKAFLENLKEQSRQNIAHNLLLTSELVRILSLFEAHGIVSVPFKGPSLAALAYGEISMRQFADLDIFLHKNDLPLVKELLVSRGYQPELPLPPAREATYLKSQYHYVLINVRNRVTVELHWEFTPRYLQFPLASQGLWDRLQRLTLGSREVLTFSPEDLLLILCVHGTEHSWERLGWICDVAHLIDSHPGLKWGGVLDLAGRLNCERMLLLGIYLATDLLGTPFPDDLMPRMRAHREVYQLARQVRYSVSHETDASWAKACKDFFFQIRVREGLWDKFRYCFYLFFTPTISDWQLVSLPAKLSFLYVMVRPLRLALKNFLRWKAIP